MTIFTLTDYADHVDNTHDYYGNHTWYALKGEDQLFLGDGRDVVYGYWGGDGIVGGGGNDKLYGENGSDSLYGGDGNDELYGGDGNDHISDEGDGQADIMSGGLGNDIFQTDGGKVNADAGNDQVVVYNPAAATNILVGTGSDYVHLDLNYWDPQRVDIREFTAADKLTFDVYTDYDFLTNGQILDLLDHNDDGWLGAKDVENYDPSSGDGFRVLVGTNTLTLEIAENDVVLYGMKNASFDFLS